MRLDELWRTAVSKSQWHFGDKNAATPQLTFAEIRTHICTHFLPATAAESNVNVYTQFEDKLNRIDSDLHVCVCVCMYVCVCVYLCASVSVYAYDVCACVV